MKQKILISAAFIFFVFVQWYSIYFMLYNHPGPLGLNDAASYIEQINFFREFPLSNPATAPSNINKILHPYIFGLMASVTGLSAENMFHLNFYIGLLLMGITLTIFFKRIDPSPLFVGTAFLIFAFYEGKGSYHGFFWVVPSFYAIMLFLLASIALFYSKHHYIYGIPLTIVLLFTHSTGIYLVTLLIASILLHETLFKKNIRGLKKTAFFSLLCLGIFLTAEYFYTIHLLPASFTSSFNSYQTIDPENIIPNTVFNDILKTISRNDFAKYFYGIYTPLVIYGLYNAFKKKQYPLLSLFFSALIGQLVISPIALYNFRFFYPLEILIWIIIAYGISILIQMLFLQQKTQQTMILKTGRWMLSGLSLLFLYNNIHQKASHNYDFKFYNPRFVENDALMNYIKEYPHKKLGLYALNPGVYQGLKDPNNNPNFISTPLSATIAQAPEKWLIIGENHRLYKASNSGFRVVLPQTGNIEIINMALQKGHYKMELIDTEIPDTFNLNLSSNGVTYTQWLNELYQVKYPEENIYPPVLLPWYWFADKLWPLHQKPMRQSNIIRESNKFSLEFDLKKTNDSIKIENNGKTLYITGMIKLVNLETGKENFIDFYWGNETSLKNNIALIFKGKRHPLLWTDPAGSPGRNYLFKLEKNFKDVKAFSFYSETKNL